MLTVQGLYGLAGCLVMGIGLGNALLARSLLKRELAINVMGAGVFMLLIAMIGVIVISKEPAAEENGGAE